MHGYIKLHRKMMGWEWYKNSNTKSLFLHILLTATHKPVKYGDIDLQPGQLVTSIRQLAADTGLSVQNVRTALKNLQLTHEVTQQVTHSLTQQQTLITVENWRFYQCEFSKLTQELTHEVTQEVTHPKNKKKENNNNNNIYIAVIDHLNKATGQNYRSTTKATRQKIDARLNECYKLDDFIAVIDKKTAQWKDDPVMSKYLRPETLFGSKFEGYLNEITARETERNTHDFIQRQDTGSEEATAGADADYSGAGSGFRVAT